MLLVSVGLPGRLAEWCDAAMSRLAGHSGEAVSSTSWPSAAEMFGYEPVSATLGRLARFMIDEEALHYVVGLRQPDDRLRSALAGGARFVLALDDPRNTVIDFLARIDAAPRSVVRAVANSCSMVMPFEGLPGALAVRADNVREDPVGAICAIAAHFDLGVAPDTAAAIAADLASEFGFASPAEESEHAALLSVDVGKMLDGALLGYRRRFAGGQLDQLIWTRELFYLASDAGQSPTAPIDVAGGARILVYGPYVHLPAGRWTARATLGFSPEAVGNTFIVDAFDDTQQLAQTVFAPARPGIHTAEVDFVLPQPSVKGVEIRVQVTSPNGKGQMAFGQVILHPSFTSSLATDDLDVSDFTHVLAL